MLSEALLVKLLEANRVSFEQLKDAYGQCSGVYLNVSKYLISYYRSDEDDLVKQTDPDESVCLSDIEPAELPDITGKQGFDYSEELQAELLAKIRKEVEERRREVSKKEPPLSYTALRKINIDRDLSNKSIVNLLEKLKEAGAVFEHRPLILGKFPLLMVEHMGEKYVVDRHDWSDELRAELFEKYKYLYTTVTDEELDSGEYTGILGGVFFKPAPYVEEDWKTKVYKLMRGS